MKLERIFALAVACMLAAAGSVFGDKLVPRRINRVR